MRQNTDGHSTEDFHKRAIEDYSQFSQHLRACLQFAFAANGGAAIAMLSCLTAIVTAKELSLAISVKIVLFRFACSAAFYLGGVFCTVLSLCAFTISKQYWGHFWEDNALLAVVDFQKEFAQKGEIFSKLGFGLLVISAFAFVPGSIMAVAAFFR